MTRAAPLPCPTLIDTDPPLRETTMGVFAAARFAELMAASPADRFDPTKLTFPSTTISGV